MESAGKNLNPLWKSCVATIYGCIAPLPFIVFCIVTVIYTAILTVSHFCLYDDICQEMFCKML